MTIARDLRHEFDTGFARAPVEKDAVEDFLAVTVASDTYVLRLGHVDAVMKDRRITRVPTAGRELVGLASYRGSVVPVFDLAVLLGLTARPTTTRWLALAGGHRVGLAFSALQGHVRVSRAALDGAAELAGVHVSGQLRPVVPLPALLARLDRKET